MSVNFNTINHPQDDIILVNADFLPLLAAVKDQMQTVKKIILLTDETARPDTPVDLDGEYESLLAATEDDYEFPDFDENAMATTFYTTGTTGQPKGVYFSHRQLMLHTAYGMSETCPVLTVANLKSHMLEWDEERQVEMRCRTGLPIPNVLLEVVDTDGKPLPHDGHTAGEVVVRAPWLTQGYIQDPQMSENLWANGWLHTGDIGFIDLEGYLQITDRVKDVIKTGGEWISSLALEDIISRHPAVSEAAVIGIPDPKWGERPVALVVLKPGLEQDTDPDALKAFFAKFAADGVIPKYGVPDRVDSVEAIAKTSVGKINKKQLREDYR